MMEVGQCRLKISKEGSDIPMLAVTPAEVMILIAGHEVSVNGKPIKEVSVIGTSKMSDANELTRLKNKYGNLKFRPSDSAQTVGVVSSLFPGSNARLPEKFENISGLIVKREPRIKVETYTPEPKDTITIQTDDPDAGGSGALAEDAIQPLLSESDAPLPEATDIARSTNEGSALNEAQDSPVLSVNRRKTLT